MRISVVIPCHNGATWLGDALASVATQSAHPAEVIVVDDASEDDVASVLQRCTIKCPCVLKKVDLRNAAAARNYAIDVATGDWLAFLDADDVWYPSHLGNAMEMLRRSNDVAYMSHFDLLTEYGTEPPMREESRPLRVARAAISAHEFVELYAKGLPHSSGTYVLRTDYVRQCQGFDVELRRRHDLDLWLRMIAGRTWSYHPDASMAYRVGTPGSLSKNVPERNYFLLRALLKSASSFQGKTMKSLINQAAANTVRTALTQGSSDDLRRAWEVAGPWLRPGDQLLLGVARVMPWGPRIMRRFRERFGGV